MWFDLWKNLIHSTGDPIFHTYGSYTMEKYFDWAWKIERLAGCVSKLFIPTGDNNVISKMVNK